MLRHVILPKQYGAEYELQEKWEVYGVPEYLVTDRAKEVKSKHLSQVAAQLDFSLRYRFMSEQGGIVESVFDKLNKGLNREGCDRPFSFKKVESSAVQFHPGRQNCCNHPFGFKKLATGHLVLSHAALRFSLELIDLKFG